MPCPTPPEEVLRAFGLVGEIVVPLPGGRGTARRAGNVILKPGCGPERQRWLGTTAASVRQDGFTLPEVVRAVDGRWSVDGWGATRVVPGVSSESGHVRWGTVVAAGRALHGALRGLPRPSWVGQGCDPWDRADAAAWGEVEPDVLPELQGIVRRLRAVPVPDGEHQLVHRDLTGNVLAAPGRPPAVIDLSLTWRPAWFGEGVVAADALSWHRADDSLLPELGVHPGAVARALLFRVLTTDLLQRRRPAPDQLARELAAYARAEQMLSSERAGGEEPREDPRNGSAPAGVE